MKSTLPPDERRAQLVKYIEDSRRTRRRLLAVGGVALAGAIVAFVLGYGGLGGVILVFDALVMGIGWWITLGHLLDFQHQLKQLDGGGDKGKRPSL